MRLILFFTFLCTSVLLATEPITPLPQDVQVDKQKALLGYKLFIDPILSKDYTVSCLSCHNIYAGGADNHIVSHGIDHKFGNIQSPTVLNARYNFKQFWNGRAENLAEQASGPIHNPVELGMDTKTVENRLNTSKEYKELFYNIYKTPQISFEQVINAIVEFENALVTPNSRFDRYLRGENTLSADEKRGYTLFKQFGCVTCHNGVNIGSNSMQKIGLFEEYKNKQSYPDLYSITHDPENKNVFKVPTLRNISQTAPYLHDGSAKTLEDAVRAMSKYQLGTTLSDSDVELIVKFLHTLDGEHPKILGQLQ